MWWKHSGNRAVMVVQHWTYSRSLMVHFMLHVLYHSCNQDCQYQQLPWMWDKGTLIYCRWKGKMYNCFGKFLAAIFANISNRPNLETIQISFIRMMNKSYFLFMKQNASWQRKSELLIYMTTDVHLKNNIWEK